MPLLTLPPSPSSPPLQSLRPTFPLSCSLNNGCQHARNQTISCLLAPRCHSNSPTQQTPVQVVANVPDLHFTQPDDQQQTSMHHYRKADSVMLSIAPLPLLVLATLPGAASVTTLLQPFVELVTSWNLPDWLIHWGHPGNMAVVLFAMGGYGSYLGWQIRLSDDLETKAKAKDLHPKLLAGMFFFFALGATGGVTSLLTSGKPIFESSHAITGLTGLVLLTIQTILTSFFQNNPGLRTVHGVLGSGIMVLFLIHAVFGLQLGLSY